MTTLQFSLPTGDTVSVTPSLVLNAGYAGRDQQQVQAHIDELAELGISGPETTPTLYPVATYLAQQTDEVPVQHDRTSGEIEWGIVFTDAGVLLTGAIDHTDRALEVTSVPRSKNAAPDVLARAAWRLDDVRDHYDQITLSAWVTDANGTETLIQRSPLTDLLEPDYWLAELTKRGLANVGTVLISGTVPMLPGVDQFAAKWRGRLSDAVTGEIIDLGYTVNVLPAGIE